MKAAFWLVILLLITAGPLSAGDSVRYENSGIQRGKVNSRTFGDIPSLDVPGENGFNGEGTERRDFPDAVSAPDGYWGFSSGSAPAGYGIRNYRRTDEAGSPAGFTRRVGGQTLRFDPEGRKTGRARELNGQVVTYGPEGEETVSPEKRPYGKARFSEPHESITWGFSGGQRFDTGD